MLSAHAQEQRNITTVIVINEELILNGASVHDARFTINNERYGDDESYYDMSDWVYPPPPEPGGGISTTPLDHELVLPPPVDDEPIKICLEDPPDYKSCKTIVYPNDNSEIVSFLYPASTSTTREGSEIAGDPIAEGQNSRYYDGFDWNGVCNDPLASNYITQSCEV